MKAWRRYGWMVVGVSVLVLGLAGCGRPADEQGPAAGDRAQAAKLHALNDELRNRLRTTQIDR